MGTKNLWHQEWLDQFDYNDDGTVRPIRPPKAQQPEDQAPALPLLGDVIAWFDQRGVSFGCNAREARVHRLGYVIRFEGTRVLIAPVTTNQSSPRLKFALPMGAVDGMFWYRDPKLQSYVYRDAELVETNYYVGTQLGKAHPPASTRVRAFVRGEQ